MNTRAACSTVSESYSPCLCTWVFEFLSSTFACVPTTGEQATRLVVSEGRKIANSCPEPMRKELLRLCDETEILTNQLADLIRNGQVMVNIIQSAAMYYDSLRLISYVGYCDFREIRLKPEP